MKDTVVRQIGLGHVADLVQVDYVDGDVAFVADVRRLLAEDMSVRVGMYMIVLCKTGKLHVELNTAENVLGADEVMLLLPHDLVNYAVPTPDFSGFAMCLSHRFVTENFLNCTFWKYFSQVLIKRTACVTGNIFGRLHLYGQLLAGLREPAGAAYRRDIVFCLVKSVVFELLAGIETLRKVEAGDTGSRPNSLFRRFMKLLSSRAVKKRPVIWYAKELCVTPKYLSGACKTVSGRTAFDWINEYVMIDIRHYLKDTDLTIKEVASVLDFPNLSFFGKYCRQHFGCAPMELRRRLRDVD